MPHNTYNYVIGSNEQQVLEEIINRNVQSSSLRKRPIYNVAHMVNGQSQINDDWVNPANAIESDLAFNSDGSPKEFYHGIPCDCFRSCIKKDNVAAHFAAIREKAVDPNKNVALFWIDLKLAASGITDFKGSGEKLAKVITQSNSLFPLGKDVPIHVLLGAEAINQNQFFVGFLNYIKSNRPELYDKFGFDFSGTDTTVEETLQAFKEIGIEKNIWVGDGIINCIPRGTSRLERILAKRDELGSDNATFKVYSWTIDNKASLIEHLQLGVDAIITNIPAKLNNLIREEFHDTLTLATQETSPWEQIKSSEAIQPFAQSCDRYWLFQFYCRKYTSRDSQCWSDKKCSRPSDCHGELKCSEAN